MEHNLIETGTVVFAMVWSRCEVSLQKVCRIVRRIECCSSVFKVRAIGNGREVEN